MKFLIYISLIFLSIIPALYSNDRINFGSKEILPPDPDIGRYDNVFQGVVYIRFSENNISEINRILDQHHSRAGRPLLPEEDFNQKNGSMKQTSTGRELQRTYRVEYFDDISPEQFCKRIRAHCDFVEVAEPFYIPKVCGEYIPNDEHLGRQKMLNTIKAFEAWDISRGDSEVVIAVSDVGVMQDHEDFVNAFWLNKGEIPSNDIDDDNNGYIDDYHGNNFSFMDDSSSADDVNNDFNGHGTAVAGIAGATSDNEIGVCGVGFNCKIFPMKTAIIGRSGIPYGYESIIYAANMGFEVVNVSWGGFNYSCINESIIRYAVESGVCVVAGAGNSSNTRRFYPATYPGVLAVGVSNANDIVDDMNNFGEGVHIFTPANDNYTTYNGGVYGRMGYTSGASPIAAGAAGIIKAYRPELGPLQIQELMKAASDDIQHRNPNREGWVQGRLNLLKALETEPFSIPGILVIESGLYDKDGNEVKHIQKGDTIELRILFSNELGAAKNVDFSISVLADTVRDADSNKLHSVELLTEQINGIDIPRESQFMLEGIWFTAIRDVNPEWFVRLDMDAGDTKYFRLVRIRSHLDYEQFENSRLSVTVGNNGTIAFTDPPENNYGEGFNFENYCSLIYAGGLIVSNGNDKAYANVYGGNFELETDKKFSLPEDSTLILSDESLTFTEKIGIKIIQDVSFPLGDKPCIRFDFTIENKSGGILDSLAIAQFMDWDISDDYKNNLTEDISYILPLPSVDESAFAAKIFNPDASISAGVVVKTFQPDAEIYFSSFTTDFLAEGFSKEEVIELLRKGIKEILSEPDEIASAAGIKFNAPVNNGDLLKFSICYCASENDSELIENLKVCAEGIITDNCIKPVKSRDYTLYPNPADDYIYLDFYDQLPGSLEIIDITGKEIKKIDRNQIRNTNRINLDDISSGTYFLRFRLNGKEENLLFGITR